MRSCARWIVAAMALTVLLDGVDLVFHPLTPDASAIWQQFAQSRG